MSIRKKLLLDKPTLYNPTHRELCERASYWLQNSRHCKVVLVERNSGMFGEEPDAIGWSSCGYSTLIEVKVSRSDFLSDKKKPHRARPEIGMGRSRFFLCPKGMIQPEEVPGGWGLLWATDCQIRLQNSDALIDRGEFEINQRKEMQILVHNYRMVKLGVMIVPIDNQENNK